MRPFSCSLIFLFSWSVPAAAVEIVQAPPVTAIHRVPISEPALRAATGSQERPAVATDGDSFFAVWADHRYGNYDIFGTRMSADGVALDPAGIPISPTWADDNDPDIVWNGRDYVVVWSSRSIGLFLARVSREGTLISSRMVIESAMPAHPSIAWNGELYLLSWSSDGSIHALLLDSEFNPRSTRFLVSPAPTAANPSVATDGESFLVVWEQTAPSPDAVLACHVTAAGDVNDVLTIGPRPAPSSSPSFWTTQAFPDIAFDGREYLVVWTDGAIRAQRMSREGSAVGTLRLLSGAELTGIAPAVSPAADGWLVAWGSSPRDAIATAPYFENLSQFDLVSMPLDREANPLASASVIVSEQHGQYDPALAWNGSRTIAVWHDERFSRSPSQFFDMRSVGDLFAASLTSGGTLRGAALAAMGEPNQTVASIAFSSGVVLAIWNEDLNDITHGSFWRRFDREGSPIGPAMRIPGENLVVSAAASAAGFLIVWTEGEKGVHALRIGLDGAALDEEPILLDAEGRGASATSDGRDFLVVWSRVVLPSRYWGEDEIRAVLVTANGLPTTPHGLVASERSGNEVWPVVAWDGTRYLAAWNAPGMFGANRVLARFISAGGVPEGPSSALPVYPKFAHVNSIASNGDGFVLAASIHLVLLDRDGNFLGNQSTQARSIVWNGRKYIAGATPMVSAGGTRVAMLATVAIPMLPSSHNGSVTRVLLAVFQEKSRAVRTGR